MTEELQNVRLSQILKDALIKATDTYSTPPQIIWIDNGAPDKPCGGLCRC